jgi:hypothetical protein
VRTPIYAGQIRVQTRLSDSARNCSAHQRSSDGDEVEAEETTGMPTKYRFLGRLGRGYYGSAYPHMFDDEEIIRMDNRVQVGQCGTILKYKPKNKHLRDAFTAVDISTRVDEFVVCGVDEEEGEFLIERAQLGETSL